MHIFEEKIGVYLRMTPKWHTEIVGQGIEYAQGYSKLQFQKHFNNAQASNLEKNVRAALHRAVLTKECMTKFARKARDYKLTYFFFFEQAAAADNDPEVKLVSGTSHDKIELLSTLFKHHMSASDSNHAFIKNTSS